MSEIDIATALARLLSQPGLRGEFLRDPERTVEKMNLRPADQQALLTLNHGDLERQAEGLIGKRFHESRHHLPLTLKALADRARPLFFHHASTFWPRGHHRHLLDSIAFWEFLQQENRGRPNRFEYAWLKFIVGHRRLHWAWVDDYFLLGRPHYSAVFFYRTTKGDAFYRAFTLLPRFRRFYHPQPSHNNP